jgi:indole-3-glycerol phosphate synthase
MSRPDDSRLGILTGIVERERLRMEGVEFPTPFRARPLRGAGPLEKALRGAPLPVIAEFKRASPSLGPFAQEVKIAAQLAAYKAGGAAAFSILAEAEHFGGRQGDFKVALGFGLPVLYKGFVCTRAHLREAASLGAHAVLLIARILGTELAAYAADARALGLEPLFEIHAMDEVPDVQAAMPRLVGWNARDLSNFSERAADLTYLRGAFPEALLIRESGLRSPELARAALDEGFQALLVGEGLMRAADPAAFLAAVRR